MIENAEKNDRDFPFDIGEDGLFLDTITVDRYLLPKTTHNNYEASKTWRLAVRNSFVRKRTDRSIDDTKAATGPLQSNVGTNIRAAELSSVVDLIVAQEKAIN